MRIASKDLIAGCLAFLLLGSAAQAQDGARAYNLLPEDTNVVSLSILYSHGGRSFGPGTILQDSELEVGVNTIIYRHPVDFWGNSGAVMVGLPIGTLSGSLSTTLGTLEAEAPLSVGDMFVAGVFGLVGTPSLSPEEYARHEPGLQVSMVGKLFAPTGEYDSTRALNLGSNRWSAQLSLPVTYAIGETMADPELTTVEFTPGVTIFGDNRDPFGSASLAIQEPLFFLEGHVTRSFGSTLWASADVLYEFGGATSTDGGPSGTPQQALTLGATLNLTLAPSLFMKLSYGEMVYSNVPNSHDRTFKLTTSYAF